MLYPKIRYKGGKLVVNEPLGTFCLVRYIRQNAISEVLISEVHCVTNFFKQVSCYLQSFDQSLQPVAVSV